MNAPVSQHALRKPLPAEFMDGLHAIFGARLSVADAVREHHGRDESPYPSMPPDAVVFAHSTEEVAELVGLFELPDSPPELLRTAGTRKSLVTSMSSTEVDPRPIFRLKPEATRGAGIVADCPL